MNAVRRVLVANLSAPELRYMAAELARRELLLTYVCRYANQQRWWERTLQRVPLAGALYRRSFGLRWIPEGLQRRHVTEAGVIQDIGAALVGRMGSARSIAGRTTTRLHAAATMAIGKSAARHAHEAGRVVAGTGMALHAFRTAALQGIPRILNYPSAHHRFQREFIAGHAQRMPEFEGLNDVAHQPEAGLVRQLDEECRLADLILVGSRFARDSFAGTGVDPGRIRNIPYGVDHERFMPGPRLRGSGFCIVYVGRVSMPKGIGYLLHAYRRFRRADTELQLVGSIIGDPACLHPYADLFSHMPHVPQSRLQQVYRDADVLVFPSLMEGLGLVVLEAMACGCPVIVTSNGPGDVVRDGVDGFVIPAGDSEAIEAALNTLYDDPALRQQMGRMARQQAELHGWSRYATHAVDAVLAAPFNGGSSA